MAGFMGKVGGNQQLVLQVVFFFFGGFLSFPARKEGGNYTLYENRDEKV